MTDQHPQEGTPPRVSEDVKPYCLCAEDCDDVRLQLRDAAQRIAALESENAALREALVGYDRTSGDKHFFCRHCRASNAPSPETLKHTADCPLANGAAAGKARDERLIQQGRDAERAARAARPVTDDAAYDAAMHALHDATSESHAWDIEWAPDEMQSKLRQALRILGAAILAARQQGRDAERAERGLDASMIAEEAAYREERGSRSYHPSKDDRAEGWYMWCAARNPQYGPAEKRRRDIVYRVACIRQQGREEGARAMRERAAAMFESVAAELEGEISDDKVPHILEIASAIAALPLTPEQPSGQQPAEDA